MCIIIDTDRMHRFFHEPLVEDAIPIHTWLQRGGAVAYCTVGKYKQELEKFDNKGRSKLLELQRNGKAFLVNDQTVIAEKESLEKTDACISNDIHILALARASGARLLYTGDNALKRDFKNKEIIDSPRGKIYSGAANKTLLKPNSCRGSV